MWCVLETPAPESQVRVFPEEEHWGWVSGMMGTPQAGHHHPSAFLSHIMGVPVATQSLRLAIGVPALCRVAGRSPGPSGLLQTSSDACHPGASPDPILCTQCLAAGSIIMNRELESMAMRPLAKELTRSLEDVRGTLRDQALRDLNTYTEKMREALRHFDVLFAEFELR